MSKTELLYNPEDVLEAHDAWRANCGPCALAAILHRPVMKVADLFPSFPGKPWVNPTTMKDALHRANVHGYHTLPSWPMYGLAFIQIEGPWSAPGVPVAVAYRRTHWVGSLDMGNKHLDADRWIYDANNDGWMEFFRWRDELVPKILTANKRATGWRVRTAISVQLW